MASRVFDIRECTDKPRITELEDDSFSITTSHNSSLNFKIEVKRMSTVCLYLKKETLCSFHFITVFFMERRSIIYNNIDANCQNCTLVQFCCQARDVFGFLGILFLSK